MHQIMMQEKVRAHQRVFVKMFTTDCGTQGSRRLQALQKLAYLSNERMLKATILSGQSRGGLQPKTVSPDWFVKGTAFQASLGITWSALSVQATPSICNKTTGSIAGRLCSILP